MGECITCKWVEGGKTLDWNKWIKDQCSSEKVNFSSLAGFMNELLVINHIVFNTIPDNLEIRDIRRMMERYEDIGEGERVKLSKIKWVGKASLERLRKGFVSSESLRFHVRSCLKLAVNEVTI